MNESSKNWHIPKNEETGLTGMCRRTEVKISKKENLKSFPSMRTAGNK